MAKAHTIEIANDIGSGIVVGIIAIKDACEMAEEEGVITHAMHQRLYELVQKSVAKRLEEVEELFGEDE